MLWKYHSQKHDGKAAKQGSSLDRTNDACYLFLLPGSTPDKRGENNEGTAAAPHHDSARRTHQCRGRKYANRGERGGSSFFRAKDEIAAEAEQNHPTGNDQILKTAGTYEDGRRTISDHPCNRRRAIQSAQFANVFLDRSGIQKGWPDDGLGDTE